MSKSVFQMNSEVSSFQAAYTFDKQTKRSNYEEYLSNKSVITVEDINQLKEPTADYLVPRESNVFGIFFTR